MKTGKVKWFNNAKGYGFIVADDGEEDLFVHYSSIMMDGYKTLRAGQAVKFDTKPSGKGEHAINILSGDEPEGFPEVAASNAEATEHHNGPDQNELAEKLLASEQS